MAIARRKKHMVKPVIVADEPQLPPITLGGTLGYGALTMLAVGVATVPLMVYVTPLVGMVAGIVAGIAAVRAVMQRVEAGQALLWAVFVAVMAAGMSGWALREHRIVSVGTTVRDIAANDAPNHPQATRFYLRDGSVQTQLVGRYRYLSLFGNSKERPRYYFVAPVVAEGWKTGDPVPLWAACDTGNDVPCTDEWRNPYRAGFAITYDQDKFREAISNAEQQHGLRSASNAPVIQWAASPDAELSLTRTLAWAIPLVVAAFWLVCVLAASLWRRVRQPAS